MPILTNKFAKHAPSLDTEILILGIFTFDVPQTGDYFFGKPRQFLWHMLPGCYNLPSLQQAATQQKIQFAQKHKIDFLDLIETVEWDADEDNLPDEDELAAAVLTYTKVDYWIQHLPKLKAVYFTRKTFNGLPNLKTHVQNLNGLAAAKGIRFCKLDTPARHFSKEKQQQWKNTIYYCTTCLKV